METLRETTPHYIRCIKPNQAKVAFEFEPQNVLGQLVACGVLETIKISRAGYPSKQTFDEFVDRYYFLVESELWKLHPKELTTKIAQKTIKVDGMYEVGVKKIFFRAGQLAFLEKIRSENFTKIIILIQKNVRRSYYVKKYLILKKSTLIIQSLWRGVKARKECAEARRINAAIVIQRNVRSRIARKKFETVKSSIICIQYAWRRHVRRRDFEYIQKRSAALNIQSVYRGHLARKCYRKTIRSIVLVQSCIRRRRCKLQFKTLKLEAKSVGNLEKVNYKLEAKILELSSRISNTTRGHAEFKEKITHLESQVSHWKEKSVKADAELKSNSTESNETIQELKKQALALSLERDASSKEQERSLAMIRKRDDQLATLNADILKLKQEIVDLNDLLKAAPKKEDVNAANVLKKEIASLREQMSRLVAGKYATDKKTENFLNHDPTETKAKNAMSFFESAAQVTVQVAESWIGTSSNVNLSERERVLRTEEAEFSEPQDVFQI